MAFQRALRELAAIPRRLDFLDLANAHSDQRSFLDAVAPTPHKGPLLETGWMPSRYGDLDIADGGPRLKKSFAENRTSGAACFRQLVNFERKFEDHRFSTAI